MARMAPRHGADGSSILQPSTIKNNALVTELAYVTDSKSVFWGFESPLGHHTQYSLCRSMDRIPCYERGDGGSIPSRGARYAVLAQSVEHLSEEQGVPGSIPGDGTKLATTSNRTKSDVIVLIILRSRLGIRQRT